MSRWLFALTICFSLACEDHSEPEPIRNIPISIQPHVDRFVYEAEKRGLNPGISNLSVEFEINILPGDDQRNIVGSCSRSSNLDLVKIDTLNSLWLLSGNLGREEIIFHELGHCLLGREHREDKLASGDYASIMRSRGLLQYGDLSTFIGLSPGPAEAKFYRRDYYLDELFDMETPVPCWSDKNITSSYSVSVFDDAIIENQFFNGFWTDPQGNLWLYRYDENYILKEGVFSIGLPEIQISDMFNDKSDNLWIAGSMNGAPVVATYSHEQLTVQFDFAVLPEEISEIHQIFIDDLGRFWLADADGKLYVGNENNGFEVIDFLPELPVSGIYAGPDNNVYMIKGQRFVIFDSSLRPELINEENSDLPTSFFGDMVVDGNGVTWLLYNRPFPQLIKFMPDQQVTIYDFYEINLAGVRLNSMAIDHLNNLWIATSHGIKRWEGDSFSSYCDYNSGLKMLDFSRIITGIDGSIWSIGKDTASLERRLLLSQPGI